ncbi:DNA repair protein RadC [Candidatus Dojkabacteria bacterium]|jgi:DNA repair protein RadC|nr:DNA repair protein RadC [Candidatus Dojkabacteria bacterium]
MLPREKFAQWGIPSLNISDLIAIIISTGNRNSNVFEVASNVERILKKGVMTYENLQKIEGVGGIKAMKLLCSIELGYRLSLQNEKKERVVTSEAAYKLLRNISRFKQEHYVAVFLNARYELVARKTIGIGTFDRVQVLPRDIIIKALEVNSAYVILAHNHPSNEPSPSKEDVEITKRMKYALDLVGITLIDNLVICENSWESVQVD